MVEYCTIELTRGKLALVSPEDFQEASTYRWFAKYDASQDRFYATRNIPNRPGKQISLHRHLMGDPDGIVDHANGDTLDYCRGNLRITDATGNARNCRISRSNKSGVKGVCWVANVGKWKAQISVARKRINLGYFEILEEAGEAYKAASVAYHGEFSRIA